MNMASFLIVDDSMVMRTVLRYMLERCGVKVLAECKDGDEAVAQCGERNPDAIALAATLRGESGLATLAALRQSGWNGRVFFLASAEQAAAESAAREAGVDSVLRKPFVLDQVSAELNRVMTGDTPA